MPILFYDHLVDYTEVHIHIDRHLAKDEHKSKAKQLVDDIVHHGIIDFILSKLQPHRHRTFLTMVHERPFDPDIIIYIRQHAHPEIEQDLRQYVSGLLSEVIEDIKSDE